MLSSLFFLLQLQTQLGGVQTSKIYLNEAELNDTEFKLTLNGRLVCGGMLNVSPYHLLV